MEEVRGGRRPFVKLDILHRENLERVLPRFNVGKLDEKVLAELNLAWHKLDAWPDVGPAFARLHKRRSDTTGRAAIMQAFPYAPPIPPSAPAAASETRAAGRGAFPIP